MKASIIIVNWNTRDILRGCLLSVYEQTHDIDYEVIVVDNASSDSSAAMVKQEFPQAILIENDVNRGFAAANNQGMRIARGQYILLLNPDTVVLDGAIQKTVEFSESRPDIGIVGCQVWKNQRVIQKTCFMFPSVWNLILQRSGLSRMFPRSSFLGRENITGWNRDVQRDVEVVSGMFMLVRREAVDQVGMMDEDYFVYAEETDWCWRFRKAGWRCVFTPVGRIFHLDGGSKSTEQISTKMYVQQQKGIMIFYKKHRGLISRMVAKTIYICSMMLRWFVFWGLSLARRKAEMSNKAVQSKAALMFHLFGTEPK